MNSPLDETEFIDRDLHGSTASSGATSRAAANPGVAPRPPTREELEARVTETQTRIAELRRAQEELERERANLEEARRRRTELETGRAEMLDSLVRGIGLLEKAEFEARRDAEQMAKTLAAFRDLLAQLQGIKEDTWTQESWNTELTRALTVIENARLEWNGARLKWTVLNPSATPAATSTDPGNRNQPGAWIGERGLGDLCKLGLALTWPLAAVALLGLVLAAVILLTR